MKKSIKILLVLLSISTLSLTACKKDKDEDQNQAKEHINPPAWIQFTWTKPNGMNGEDGFKFTSNDMFTVMYDQNGNQTMILSYMESIKNKDYNIDEQSTNSSYQFTVHYNETNSSETWQFQLLANGQLQYIDNMQSTFTYTKRN